MTIYVIVVSLVMLVNYSIQQIKNGSVVYEDYFNGLYYQFASLQVLILCLWAPFNSRSALKQEIFDKTYDFFRLLPLSALQKTVGILVGRNILVILLAAMTFIPIMVFGALGKASAFLRFQSIFLLLSTAVFLNSAALLSFNTVPGRQKKIGVGVWIVLFFFLWPFLIQFLLLPFYAMSKTPQAEDMKIKFYGSEIHVLIFIALVSLYFSFWNILGIVRKFTYENEPIFRRKGAVVFLLGYEFLVFGLFVPRFLASADAAYDFWLVAMLPVFLIPLGSVKTFEDYLESCGLAGRFDAQKSMTPVLFKNSNLTLAFILFAIWLCFAVFTGAICELSASQLIINIVVLFSFYLFLVLLLELYVVYSAVVEKIGLLLGFFAALYLFLPLILSSTLQTPSLRFYSLIGFFTHLLNPLADHDVSTCVCICIVNALLCLTPVLLILKRYSHILTLRKKPIVNSK